MAVRIGFIGCGLIARAHANNLKSVSDAHIVAGTDTDAGRASTFASDYSAEAFSSSAEVIQAADAVYVTTWTSEHPGLVGEVIGAGRAVFCEKPLATNFALAKKMAAQAHAAGVVSQVGLVLRHSPSFRFAKAKLQGADIMNIVFRDDQYLPTQGMYASTWRGDVDKAGAGTLLEHSIHDLDLLDWLGGPLEVRAAATNEHHGLPGIEDQATVLLTSEAGTQASLTSVWHDVMSRPSQRSVEIICRDRFIHIEGDWTGPVHWEDQDGAGSLSGTDLQIAAHAFDELGTNPDADFVRSVMTGEAAYPNFETALRAHQLADDAYRMARAR